MKPLLAVIIIALLTLPSFAQSMGGRKHRAVAQKSVQPRDTPEAAVDQADRPCDSW